MKNVTYKEMEQFILSHVEYTYNVSKCLNNFINDLGETGAEEGIFFMTDDQEHFKISIHYFLNNDTEEIKYTYDVEKL